MDRKITSALKGSALLVAATGILSRGTGFLREVVFAGYFGANEEFDIYLAGTVLPFIINTSIYYIAQNYLIPLFNTKVRNDSELIDVTRRNFKLFIGTGLVLILILFLLKDVIINNYLWNSSYDVKNLAGNIFIITLFTLPLNSGYSVLAAYYQSQLKFKYPALLPLVQNIFVIVIIIISNKMWGIYSIPVGYLSGYLIQFIVLVMIFDYRKLLIRDFSLRFINFGISKSILIIIAIEVINQLYLFIDRYFLNYVETGGIAALSYSNVLFSLPISIVSFSIATTAFPVFSNLVESNRISSLKGYFHQILMVITAFFILLTMLYYFWGDVLIKAVYERGNFSSADTHSTFQALRMYSVSLVFYAAFSIIYKMMFSIGLSRLLLIFSIISFVIKYILNIFLVKELGYYGLALSTSISYIAITVSCYLAIINNFKQKMVTQKVR